MTTDTEALRAQFERRMNLRGWSEANIRRDGLDYSSTQITEAWHAFQAGYAAAKAETAADVGEPVAWRWKYRFKDIGETGAYEYHSHHYAVIARIPKGEPLYTADQLAAAVAKERERCIGIIESHHIPVGNSAAGEMACEWTYDALKTIRDAIRAGEKGEPS